MAQKFLMPKNASKCKQGPVGPTAPEAGSDVGTSNTRVVPTKKKSRGFVLTLWSSHWDLPKLQNGPWDYILAGRETCPKTKREHWQCWFHLKTQRYWGPVKEDVVQWFGTKELHLEPMTKSIKENDDYCRKDGDWYEWGLKPQQGKRSDLDSLAQNLMAGATTVEAVALTEPETYHQYGRTLEKIQDLALRKKYRTEMTEGIWIWGATGTGKSHMAYKDYNPETHYVWPNDGGWWDGYSGQAIVIINDFRGEIPYNQMLQMIDKWPFCVRRRGREPFPFLAHKVIITSSLSPEAVYHRRDAEDSLEQLLRRIQVIHLSERHET